MNSRHLVWKALRAANHKAREEFPVGSEEGFEAMKRYALEEYERLEEEEKSAMQSV